VIRSRRLLGSLLLDRRLAPVLTVVFAGLLVSTLLAYFYTKNTMEGLALGQTTQALGFMDREVTARIREVAFNLDLWSQEDVFRLSLENSYLGLSAREAGRKRLAGRVANKDFDRLFLIRPDGEVVIASAEDMVGGINIGHRSYFIRSMAGKKSLETLAAGYHTGRPILVAAAPVVGPGQEVLGVLASAIGTEKFDAELLRDVRIGKSGVGFILDGTGLVLAASSPGASGQIWPQERLAKVLESAETGGFVTYPGEESERMLVAKINATTGWYLVLSADAAEVLRPATQLAWISGIISALTLALVPLALGAMRRAMTGLEQSEEKFSKLFFLSPDSILLLDLDTLRIEDVNETFCRRWGYNRREVVGKTALELALYTDQAALGALYERILQEGRVENFEIETRSKDNLNAFCSVSGQIVDIGRRRRLLLIVRDVTEQKKMHEMMIQSEKMASVGGLAAGMAHEINNPLSSILQAAQVSLMQLDPALPANQEAAVQCGCTVEAVRCYLEKRRVLKFLGGIQEAGIRAGTIVASMLEFSRKSDSRRGPVNINQILDNSIELASTDYDLKKKYDFRHITIVRRYDPGLAEINCSRTEIEQVMLNLLKNAAQAMAGQPPGEAGPVLTLETSRVNGSVRIVVSDNGSGMTEAQRRRIFEPFFTTKPLGEGTGLGLAVSYFIITAKHGGTISVESKPGKGTSFVILLPIA
jgi:PAS domain S-box-containing protein